MLRRTLRKERKMQYYRLSALFFFFFRFFFVELRRSTFFFLWLQSACKSFPLFSYTNANEADFVLYLLHPHDIPCSFLFSSVLSELMVKQRQLFIAPNDVTVDFFVLLFFFFSATSLTIVCGAKGCFRLCCFPASPRTLAARNKQCKQQQPKLAEF